MTDAIRWKNGARCAVTLSFDVDGESPWIHRDKALADRPLHMSMGAYGPKTGVPRILKMLERLDRRPIPRHVPGHRPSRARGRPSWVSTREALLPLGPRRGRSAPGEEPRHLQEDPRRHASRLSRALRRSEQAHYGAVEAI